MIKYEIEGGSLPVLICYPEPGETLCTQSGAMSWMSPNMNMETNSGGGIKKALGRFFSGDSLFMNEYSPQGGTGLIAFGAALPGKIIPYEVTPGNGIIIQKSGFLAMEKGLDLSIYFQKRVGAGLLGGEGFVLQKVTGNGLVFIEIDGYCKEYNLGAGESIIVDSGYLAAMTESCSMDIQSVKGIKNVFFGGEGLFNTVITGPGKVYVQSMPASSLAEKLAPFISVSSGSSDNGGGGIKINLNT